jgi:hypothetical protein
MKKEGRVVSSKENFGGNFVITVHLGGKGILVPQGPFHAK